jgi:uncharacterized protein
MDALSSLQIGTSPSSSHRVDRIGDVTAWLPIRQRIARVDWSSAEQSLNAFGNVVLPGLLSRDECLSFIELYSHDEHYRSRIVMARHGFGRGEYKYFAYPLPTLIGQLRTALYPVLAPIANRWNQRMRIDVHYPDTHDEFIHRCHAAGQRRPTPLILRYDVGDYNCLHQDLYGEHVFPLQAAILLSRPGRDFKGGEFVMTEQRTGQRRAEVIPLGQGDAVVFAVHQRPVQGTHRTARAALRHGVSEVLAGKRYTVGIILHDAT